MKRPEIKPVGINEATENVVRSSSEPEDIDLAAEATDSAAAKTLRPASKRRQRTSRRARRRGGLG